MLRQKTIINMLNKLADGWDDRLQLFADNGSLELINYETGEVLASFIGIECDGGDPDHSFIDGKDFILNLD